MRGRGLLPRIPHGWLWVGLAASVAGVAGLTGVVAAVEPHVPALALSVLYLLAIVPVAVLFGRWFAIPVAVLSVAAFNFFFLEPRHSLSLADGENWFALAVFLVVAVVVSDLAARARRRAAEAEQRGREEALLAELATTLLEGAAVDEALVRLEPRLAVVVGAPGARVRLGAPAQGPLPLVAGGATIGELLVDGPTQPGGPVLERFLPALATLVAVARERELLAAQAVEAAALRESDAVKTAVLRSVSHDLRSPLTAIRVAADSLGSRDLALSADDRASLVETIRAEAARLDRVVADLLDLSRLQAGAAAPERELWEVAELVAEAVDQLGPRAARVRSEGPAVSPLVEVDAVHVERALGNVLENALAHSPPGEEVVVRVTATRRDVIVRVVDHGPGIPEAELERIFEPFYRGPGGAGRSGSGLGLAIARGFVEANAGRVWAESREGQGAALAIALPLATVPAEVAR